VTLPYESWREFRLVEYRLDGNPGHVIAEAFHTSDHLWETVFQV
jgi:hypothetical protein